MVSLSIVLAAALGLASLGPSAVANVSQVTTSVSFTVTTTSIYPMTTAGVVHVYFDSIQLTNPPPQAYSFGVSATTFPGLWITKLVWQFGDGAFLDVPYCCQSRVSDVRYHAYATPGSYTVVVVAYDNVGNVGSALVTVDWITPIPEYPSYSLPLIASLVAALVAAAALRKRIGRVSPSTFSH